MTAGDAERRLLALERKVREMEARPAADGPMVSQHSGRTVIRPWQVGFPAELTSAFDGATGYDWKQLLLVQGAAPVVDEDPDNAPLAGDRAHTPDNDETLSAGDRGWLEPDPQAGGWIFVKGGTGGSLAFDSAALATSYAITASFAWQDVGLSLSLPTAGTYLVLVTMSVVGGLTPPTTGATGGVAQILGGVVTGTGTGVISSFTCTDLRSSGQLGSVPGGATGTDIASRGTGSAHRLLTVAGATTVKLQAWRDNPQLETGQAWTTSTVLGSTAPSGSLETRLSYLKIA